MRVLVVENPPLACLLKQYKHHKQYPIDVVEARPGDAIARLRSGQYHMVVTKSLNIVREMRRTHMPAFAVVIPRDGSQEEEIEAFELGADDVLRPDAHREVLIEKIRAIGRWAQTPAEETDVLVRGPLEIDATRHRCTINNRDICLTFTEFEILRYLARHPGQIRTRVDIIKHLNYPYEVPMRAIDSHIKRIRKGLKAADATRSYIKSVYGMGYSFIEI